MAFCFVDRYPSDGLYAIDSARIAANGWLTSWMAKVEAENYAKMPPPDLVFKMMAPLDVTLARNAQRQTPEPEGFVKQRYEKAQSLEFATSEVIDAIPMKILIKQCCFCKIIFGTVTIFKSCLRAD